MKKQEKYIGKVRNTLFSPGFIKAAIFHAWRNFVIKKKRVL